jgi:hypothetical protein
MTKRDQVLAILRGDRPDRVPWFGDLDYWATALIKRGQFPPDFKTSKSYIDWHRDLDVGFYLQGHNPYEERITNCGVEEWHDGNFRYRTIETPYGTLKECWQWLETSFSEGHVEYLVKDVQDLDAYRYLIENTEYSPDYSFAEKRNRQIGDMGVQVVYTPRTPFMHLLAMDCGITNLATIYAVDPEGLSETIALMSKKFREAARITVECPADIVMIPENLSSEMVGKGFFSMFMRDIQTEWAELIREAGKFSCIHMDGTLKGLLKQELDVGFSFIEACTPAPAGDVEIEEWNSYREGSETLMWGGIPGVYFTSKVSDTDFDAFIIRVLEVMTATPKYVLGVADQVPPDGLERRVRRVGELIAEHGYYSNISK